MTPLRYAFLSSPLAGHLNPTLAVASHLRRAGHAVSYHLPERFRDQVEEAGASVVPSSPPFDAGTDPLRKFAITPIDMTRSARHVLPQVLSSLSEHPADVIV
jgi:UDP:flavonoid glycosyltransferase YjiC (YdhE family)